MEQIKYVAFDLDDTLISTREIFHQQEAQVFRTIALVLAGAATEAEIKDSFMATNDLAYQTHKVNPSRWDFVLDKMCYHYPRISNGTKSECLDILMEIYNRVPKLKGGAIETLTFLKDAGVGMGLITHAFDTWTNFKIDRCGLRPYFDDLVFVVDMNSSKDAREWQKGFDKFKFPVTSQSAVVGDSLLTDINPAYEIGVKNLFWVDDGQGWKVHRAEKPEIAKRISGIGELLAVMRDEKLLV